MNTISNEVKEQIKAEFLSIKKVDDLYDIIIGVLKFHNLPRVSRKQFAVCIRSLNIRYKKFVIKKKSGGERIINAPIGPLMLVQKALKFIMSLFFETHHKAMGFVEEKSVVDNAHLHIGKNYVYNIDLKDFFHSVERWQVKHLFMRKPFYFTDEREDVAFTIANLCTFLVETDGVKKVVLPQGAPTSPILTNILCKRMDFALDKLAKKHKATYSRYADDITFSSNKSVFKNPDFLKELEEIIVRNGFCTNTQKTRLQKKNARQEVTGITVNEKLNTARKYVKQIRMWLYLIEKYGVQKSEGIFRRDYIREKGHTKYQGNPMFNVIEGKLLYLKMVKGEGDNSYQKLAQRFDKIREFDVDKILKIWEENGMEEAQELFASTKIIPRRKKRKVTNKKWISYRRKVVFTISRGTLSKKQLIVDRD
ncbi:RNA-directed DNA polymerase [Bergeyella porcorum]|uniref:RNA-directed DNA polymerase n=1 Tax=Bergeyella porcorum TaxID=1735111 RepID=A0AAU0F1I9_9FLAO